MSKQGLTFSGYTLQDVGAQTWLFLQTEPELSERALQVARAVSVDVVVVIVVAKVEVTVDARAVLVQV